MDVRSVCWAVVVGGGIHETKTGPIDNSAPDRGPIPAIHGLRVFFEWLSPLTVREIQRVGLGSRDGLQAPPIDRQLVVG